MIGIVDSPSGVKKLMERTLPTRRTVGSLANLMPLIGFRY
jgi:hypothetical protein